MAEQLCSDDNIDIRALKNLNFSAERESMAIKLLSCSGMQKIILLLHCIYTFENVTVNMDNVCVLCGKTEDDDDIYHNKWVMLSVIIPLHTYVATVCVRLK